MRMEGGRRRSRRGGEDDMTEMRRGEGGRKEGERGVRSVSITALSSCCRLPATCLPVACHLGDVDRQPCVPIPDLRQKLQVEVWILIALAFERGLAYTSRYLRWLPVAQKVRQVKPAPLSSREISPSSSRTSMHPWIFGSLGPTLRPAPTTTKSILANSYHQRVGEMTLERPISRSLLQSASALSRRDSFPWCSRQKKKALQNASHPSRPSKVQARPMYVGAPLGSILLTLPSSDARCSLNLGSRGSDPICH